MSEASYDLDGDAALQVPVRKALVVAIENIVNPPAPEKPCTLLHALTAMSLNAKLNGSASSLIRTGYALMYRVKPKYASVIANIISATDPVEHMNLFVKTLPDRVLKMNPGLSQ